MGQRIDTVKNLVVLLITEENIEWDLKEVIQKILNFQLKLEK